MSRQSDLPEKDLENIINRDNIKKDLQVLFEKARRDDLWFILKDKHILTPDALEEEQAKGNLIHPFEDWTLKHPNKLLTEAKEKVNVSESTLAKARFEYEQGLAEFRAIQRAIEVLKTRKKEESKDDKETKSAEKPKASE